MTEAARTVLASFEALASSDQSEVAQEILRRASSNGLLSDLALVEVADDLFRSYDAEEAARAASV